jgi:hypothetical protein
MIYMVLGDQASWKFCSSKPNVIESWECGSVGTAFLGLYSVRSLRRSREVELVLLSEQNWRSAWLPSLYKADRGLVGLKSKIR